MDKLLTEDEMDAIESMWFAEREFDVDLERYDDAFDARCEREYD